MHLGKINFLWYSLTAALFLAGCQVENGISYRTLHIEGVTWACNVSTSYISFGTISGEDGSGDLALPAADGDLLLLMNGEDEGLYYRYREIDGNRLVMVFDTTGACPVYINDRMAALLLTGDAECLEAFRAFTDAELRQVSTLYFLGEVGPDILEALKSRESVLSGTGLILEDGAEENLLSELIAICKPVWFCCDDPLAISSTGVGNSLSNLELLWIRDNQYAISELLPYCTDLNAMIISDWHPGPGELISLKGMNRLTSITLAECSLKELGPIELPGELVRLHFIYCDTLRDTEVLSRLPALVSFGLTGTVLAEWPEPQEGFDRFRWLSFPSNTEDASFSSIVTRSKNLEIAEVVECDSVTDLSPLEQLNKLRVLMYEADNYDLDQLGRMSQLKLLVLDQSIFKYAPDGISSLRASLPDTEIYPGSGLCLGSGWLLLLIPLILIFRFIIISLPDYKSRL